MPSHHQAAAWPGKPVNRVLADLDRRGLIARSHRQYVLQDVDRLRRLAGL